MEGGVLDVREMLGIWRSSMERRWDWGLRRGAIRFGDGMVRTIPFLQVGWQASIIFKHESRYWQRNIELATDQHV